MDDAEYEETFRLEHDDADTAAAGTPRPGTSDADIKTAIKEKELAIWSFSQAAKQHAADVKRRRSPKSRTMYRMGANTLVKNAFETLKKKLDETREVHQSTSTSTSTPHLSEDDFKLLKQGIENFRVNIVMDDSITFEELAQMRNANRTELTKTQIELQAACGQSYLEAKSKNAELLGWDTALTAEIIRVRQTKGTTPSQHAQISPNAGAALRNILTPHTIRSKFTSLHNLTKQVRQELIAFLTSDARANDRVEVVNQIKEACIAARKKAKEQTAA